MSSARGLVAIALALSTAVLAAGCGSVSSAERTPAAQAPIRESVSLDSSFVTAAGTWAIADMGGSSAQHSNFWQLFVRPAGSTLWKLVTPPGVADNGGLVVADTGGRSLVTGFRPSQDLSFTPLTATADAGQDWSSANPLDGALANVPDALAAAPGSGNLLALLTNGTAKLASPGYATWSALSSLRSLAATSSGRTCGLQNLTGAAFTPSGTPLLAGTCSHPGTAGIFAGQNGIWQASGPALPATLAHQTVTVLRLTTTPGATIALLQAGAGPAASLLAAWLPGSGSHWTLSAPFRLNGARLTAASFGSGGMAAVILNGNRGEAITKSGSPWRPLPALPEGAASLAPGPAGALDALAVHLATLTVWRLAPGSATWTAAQTVNVPIQSGSSG